MQHAQARTGRTCCTLACRAQLALALGLLASISLLGHVEGNEPEQVEAVAAAHACTRRAGAPACPRTRRLL